MKGKKNSKWSNFEKKQDQSDTASIKQTSVLQDNSVLTLNTHTVNEFQSDIIIHPELVVLRIPQLVEVQVKTQPIKFFVLITQESLTTNVGKNQISIIRPLTELLKVKLNGLKFQAQFKLIEFKDAEQYSLDIIEICIRDYFVSRRDQMKINQNIQNTTAYINKNFYFGSLKVQITNMINQKIPSLTLCGLITPNTKILYRSLEARVTLLIEVSKELFQTNKVGDVALEALQKFLRLYQTRNSYFQTNHRVEIFLFARLYYPQFKTLDEFYNYQLENKFYREDICIVPLNPFIDQTGQICIDLIQKVPLPKPLKLAENFHQLCMRGIQELIYQINWQINAQQYKNHIEQSYASKVNYNGVYKLKRMMPECELSSSQNSNVLEAICLATQTYSLDFATRSLNNSGHSVIVISAGNGLYFGEEHLYKLAKVNIMKNNVSCFLVAFKKHDDNSQIMILLQNHSYPVNEEPSNLIYSCIEKHVQDQNLMDDSGLFTSLKFLNRTGFTLDNLETFKNQDLIERFPKIQQIECGHFSHMVLKKIEKYNKKCVLKHAYWISMIYNNDQMHRLFQRIYERPIGVDFLWKFLQTSSQNNRPETLQTTLLPYVDLSNKFYFPESQSEKDIVQTLKNVINNTDRLNDLNQNLIKLQTKSKYDELQDFKKRDDAQQRQYITRTISEKPNQQPNIFKLNEYVRQKETSQIQETEEKNKQISIDVRSQKKCSHYRLKWDQYFMDSKIQSYFFQMKEDYQRLTEQFLRDQPQSDDDKQIFKFESQWKNLTHPPLFPLTSIYSYQSQKSFEIKNILLSFVRQNDKIDDFIHQIKGILLSDVFENIYQYKKNFQEVLDKPYDQFGHQEQEKRNTDQKMPIRLIKGEILVRLDFTRNYKQIDPTFNVLILNKKKVKIDQLHYGTTFQLHPIHYKYIMFDHRQKLFQSKQCLIQDREEINYNTLINQFTDDKEYTVDQISTLNPKRICFVILPQEAINENKEKRQQQFYQWSLMMNKFFATLRDNLISYEQKFSYQLIDKMEKINQEKKYNLINLIFQKVLKNYYPYLHPPQYEGLSLEISNFYLPQSSFNFNIYWISSSSLPITDFIKVLNICSKISGLNIIQIPSDLSTIFQRSLVFEQTIKIKCKFPETIQRLKKIILHKPFEFFRSYASKSIYLHRKGLAFVDFRNQEIQWKENGLICEIPENNEIIDKLFKTLKNYIFSLEIVFELIQKVLCVSTLLLN